MAVRLKLLLLWRGFAWVQKLLPLLGLTRQSLLGPHVSGESFLEFKGHLAEIFEDAAWTSGFSILDHGPSFFWPNNRSWFVGTGIDFDSTIMDGDRSLIKSVLDDPDLEAWPVEPTDSLMRNADLINTD